MYRKPILTQTSAPSSYPITLDEVKAHLRVDFPDDDSYLTRLIAAASARCDYKGMLGRAVITQTWKVQVWRPDYKTHPTGAIALPVTPVQSISTLTYYDANNASQSLTTGNFQIIDRDWWAYIIPNDGTDWPGTFDREDALTATFLSGYGDASTDVPEDLRQCIFSLVAHWYENREATMVGSEVQTMPFGFHDMIETYRDVSM